MVLGLLLLLMFDGGLTASGFKAAAASASRATGDGDGVGTIRRGGGGVLSGLLLLSK